MPTPLSPLDRGGKRHRLGQRQLFWHSSGCPGPSETEGKWGVIAGFRGRTISSTDWHGDAQGRAGETQSERACRRNSLCRRPGLLSCHHQLPGLAVAAGRTGITLNDYELRSRDSYRPRFARSRIVNSKQSNQRITSSMKKIIPFVLYSTAAALCLGAVSASPGYVTPRVPPDGSNSLATTANPSY